MVAVRDTLTRKSGSATSRVWDWEDIVDTQGESNDKRTSNFANAFPFVLTSIIHPHGYKATQPW
jgi:hypothetical protein